MENKPDPTPGDAWLNLTEDDESFLPGQALAAKAWERFKQLGLYQSLLRAATLISTLVVMVLIVLIFRRFYVNADGSMVTQL